MIYYCFDRWRLNNRQHFITEIRTVAESDHYITREDGRRFRKLVGDGETFISKDRDAVLDHAKHYLLNQVNAAKAKMQLAEGMIAELEQELSN